jgi:hypothetical protein
MRLRHQWILIVVGLCLAPVSARGQDDAAPVVPLEGLQAFRQLLHYEKLTPATTGVNEPSKTLLIFLGRPPEWTAARGRRTALQRFVADGGAVLIATAVDPDRVLAQFELELATQNVQDVVGFHSFHGHRECPTIPMMFYQRTSLHPLFQGLTSELATNCPTSIHSTLRRPTTPGSVIVFPNDCWGGGGPDIHPLTYAVGSPAQTQQQGRYLILAGEGLFRNGMMLRKDTDNLRFAWNAIRWLGKGRTHAQLFEDGEIVTKFDGPLSFVPRTPALPNPVPIFETMLSRLEKDDFFNKQLAKIPRVWIMRVALILGTAVLLVWARRRLVAAHHVLESEAPLVDVAVAQARDELSPMSLRHRAQVKNDNYGELAQALSRQFFEKYVPGAQPGSSFPAVDIAAGWWTRRRLLAQLRDVWDLAFGREPARITGRRLQDLLTTLEHLAAAADSSLLCFPTPAAA